MIANRSKIGFLIVIGVLVMALLAVWLWPRANVLLESGVGDKQNFDLQLREAEHKKGAPLTDDEKRSFLSAPMAKIAELAAKMDMESVVFYARVVDQYGDGVPDVSVRVSVMGSMLGGYTPLRGHTSQNGDIKFEATGGAITVMGIEKPGYVFLGATCYSDFPFCEFGSTDYFAAAGNVENEKSWYVHKTPDKAYVFRVHKLANVYGVKKGMLALEPQIVGQWQTAKFSPEDDVSDADGFAGQLRARLLDDSADGWKVEIQAIGGGIQLAAKDDAYMSVAPESGYQDTYIFDCKRDATCRGGNPRRFYFYSNGGREYGAIAVRIAGGKEGGFVRGSYRVNTYGNRDLNVTTIQNLDLDGVYQ